jgi:hypothetical protein
MTTAPQSPLAPLRASSHPIVAVHPVIYQINTRPCLNELGRDEGRPATLGQVPDRRWDDLVTARAELAAAAQPGTAGGDG